MPEFESENETDMFVQLLTPRTGAPIELSRINVVMGGNQSGKTTLLRDIYRLVTGREPHSPVDSATFPEPVLLEDLQYSGAQTDEQLSSGPCQSFGVDGHRV